jgi:hypothetical protein
VASGRSWVVHERHRTGGQEVSAQTFAQLAWKAGCREPRLVAAYANLLAAPGDEAALRRAADACEEALQSRDGSTFDGWTELGANALSCSAGSNAAEPGRPSSSTRTVSPSPCAATLRRNRAAPGPAASRSDRYSRAPFAAGRDCLRRRSAGRA